MRTRRAVLGLAAVAAVGCASGSGRGAPVPPRPGDELSGFGTLEYGPLLAGDQYDGEMDAMLRQHYATWHVTPAQADCLVEQVKRSPKWQPETRSLKLTADEQNGFAEACHIDWDKLWLERTD